MDIVTDEALRQKVLKTLKLHDASPEDQELALYHLESVVQKRLARAVPGLLTDEQLKQVEDMHKAGRSEGDIVAWIQGQIPAYDELYDALIQDVAEEIVTS